MYCATVWLLHIIPGVVIYYIYYCYYDMPLVLGFYFNSSYFIYLLDTVSVRSLLFQNCKFDEKMKMAYNEVTK